MRRVRVTTVPVGKQKRDPCVLFVQMSLSAAQRYFYDKLMLATTLTCTWVFVDPVRYFCAILSTSEYFVCYFNQF
jgi:hypothetical protein